MCLVNFNGWFLQTSAANVAHAHEAKILMSPHSFEGSWRSMPHELCFHSCKVNLLEHSTAKRTGYWTKHSHPNICNHWRKLSAFSVHTDDQAARSKQSWQQRRSYSLLAGQKPFEINYVHFEGHAHQAKQRRQKTKKHTKQFQTQTSIQISSPKCLNTKAYIPFFESAPIYHVLYTSENNWHIFLHIREQLICEQWWKKQSLRHSISFATDKDSHKLM